MPDLRFELKKIWQSWILLVSVDQLSYAARVVSRIQILEVLRYVLSYIGHCCEMLFTQVRFEAAKEVVI